jgi:hypothetical protein
MVGVRERSECDRQLTGGGGESYWHCYASLRTRAIRATALKGTASLNGSRS